MQNLVGDFFRPRFVSSLSLRLTPQIELPSNFFLSKPQKIQHDGLPLLLSFSSTNQTTIASEMTDGKRQREKKVEKERHNQVLFCMTLV